jgi:hypothetical protein
LTQAAAQPTQAPAKVAAGSAPSAAAAKLPPPPPPVTIEPQINLSVNFSGVPSSDVGTVLVGAIKAKESELSGYFGRMIAAIASNQRRLAYDQ